MGVYSTSSAFVLIFDFTVPSTPLSWQTWRVTNVHFRQSFVPNQFPPLFIFARTCS